MQKQVSLTIHLMISAIVFISPFITFIQKSNVYNPEIAAWKDVDMMSAPPGESEATKNILSKGSCPVFLEFIKSGSFNFSPTINTLNAAVLISYLQLHSDQFPKCCKSVLAFAPKTSPPVSFSI